MPPFLGSDFLAAGFQFFQIPGRRVIEDQFPAVALHEQFPFLRLSVDYDAELETEEEEAAPVSEKRLKRELRAEAIRRLEEAARTEKDFRAVVEEWNKLDRNRERRERDHENLRGDVPLEYQAVPEPKLIPRWMNNPAYRQLMAGNFLDILFDCPYEMHNLTADPFISRMVEELSEEHKEVLYFLSLRLYSTTRLAAVRGQSDRNIRKLRKTIHKKLQRQNLLIDAYLSLTRTPDNLFLSVAEQERQKLNAKLKREKMLFISDIVGSSGNAVKFLLPPNCGNPCALNLSQWFELIRRSCSMAKEAMRDRTAETVMENRDVLQKNWDLLLSETGLTEV